MPELDFALVCDFVRLESKSSVANVVGGGIDTIIVEELPAGQSMGLWNRVLFTRSECDREHRFEVVAQDADGARLLEIRSLISPRWSSSLPAGWKVPISIAYNLAVPLPHIGDYSFEILLNDSSLKSIPFRVIQSSPSG